MPQPLNVASRYTDIVSIFPEPVQLQDREYLGIVLIFWVHLCVLGSYSH